MNITPQQSFANLRAYFSPIIPLIGLDQKQQCFTWRLLAMAGIGKKFDFHGSFLSKEEAMKKEKEVGGFIREKRVKGQNRYFVLTVKK